MKVFAQTSSRLSVALLAVCFSLAGAVLPEGMGPWKRIGVVPEPAPLPKVWQEFGLREGETASFADGAKKMAITAWRFPDATGSVAAFHTIQPGDAKPNTLSKLSVGTENSALVSVGNYLFRFSGLKPNDAELNYLVGVAPHYAASPAPPLINYLPQAGRIPNSERYIVGPESLAAFAPGVPPSTVGFHFGAEADVVKYGSKGKESTLIVFSYPTMEMARDRLPQFQQLSGVTAKRTGPLVALVLRAANPDDVERLLAQVKYQAEITVTERVPTVKDNPANLFLNIAILVGILAGFCVLSGLAVGGLKYLFRRGGSDGEGEPMISLHLSGHP